MAKKSTTARPGRETRYFNLEEETAAWRVYKKKKGFYLWASEEGEVNGPCKTISEAPDWEAVQYGNGQHAKIDTNIQLEELFGFMNMHNFEPFLHNLANLHLNGVEIDAESFKNFVIWYAECQKASAAKEPDPVDKRAP